MEVEWGRFVGCSVGIEDKPAGSRAHGLTEQLLADKLAEYQPWSLYVRGCRVEWQAACAAKRRSLVVRTIQACRSWPVSELWSAASPLPGFAVRSAGRLAGSIAFPQGKFRRERPPAGRQGACENPPRPMPVPGPQRGGSLPSASEIFGRASPVLPGRPRPTRTRKIGGNGLVNSQRAFL